MKVKVSVTVDIDAAAWRLTYGAGTATEVREDVQRYAANLLTEQFRAVGVLAQ